MRKCRRIAWKLTGVLTFIVIMGVVYRMVNVYSVDSAPNLVQHSVSEKYSDFGDCKLYNNKTWHCPDVRHLASTKRRQVDFVLTRLLLVFRELATKHGLRYWMCRGTLLGAVRHGVNNPFEDMPDLDVAIIQSDFQKFLWAVDMDGLPSDVFLQSEATDLAYRNPGGIPAKLRDTKSCYKTCLKTGCKHMDGLQIDIIFIKEKYGYLLEPTDKFTFRNWFRGEIKTYSDVFPLQFLNFEGFSLPAPRTWHKVLRVLYNRYEIPPSPVPFPDIDASTSCRELHITKHAISSSLNKTDYDHNVGLAP